MSEKPQRVAIYSRKSRFTGKGESIENQIELCREYISMHFPEAGGIVVYEDEGFSGGETERPQFKKMLANARAHEFNAIVCYRLDRISRNVGDFAKLIEELEALGISFVSIKERFDTSSPAGRAMMYMSSVFSQLERETIAERIRDNMRELSKTGRWLGGISPTGYRSECVETVIGGKLRKSYRLAVLPGEAELVKLVFTKFLETNSLTKTEAFLIQNGFTTKSGKFFTRFSLKNILTNPVYMIADNDAFGYFNQKRAAPFVDAESFDGVHGIAAYNRTLQKRGHAHRVRPMDEWVVSVGKHDGIISGADWVKTQRILEQNRSKSYRKPRSNSALLSGLLFCGNCGSHMRPKLTNRLNADRERSYSYLCVLKERSRGCLCGIKNVSGNALDNAVCAEIRKLSEDVEEFMRILESGAKGIEGLDAQHCWVTERMPKMISDNNKQIAALVAALARAQGTNAENYILAQIEELHEKGEKLKRRAAEENNGETDAISDTLIGASKELATLGGALDFSDTPRKREILRAVIEKAVWDGEKAHIYFFGADN